MKKITVLVIALFSLVCISKQSYAQVLKKVMELKMPKTSEDEKCGTRGAAVAWHPEQKKYYASFAGNAVYPFAVFDATGKRLSSDTATAMQDVRGLWYNPKTKRIEGNAYYDYGWFFYKLNAKGIVAGQGQILAGQLQPNEQSVGVYDTKNNQILFLDGSEMVAYNYKDGQEVSSFVIHWGKKKTADIDTNEHKTMADLSYNTTPLYNMTAKGNEIGFLNIDTNTIEWYSSSTGLLVREAKLPEGTETYSVLSLSYSNGIVWLFDQVARTWKGYK